MVDNFTGEVLFLEMNALMNLGEKGGFVLSLLHDGFKSYDDIIAHIVDLGIKKVGDARCVFLCHENLD